MEYLVPMLIGFVIGVACGAAGYRWMVKNDPVKLEKWAKELKDM